MICNNKKWAKDNFGGIKCKDIRRSSRIISVAEVMSRNIGKSIPKSYDNSYDIKATYNLFKEKEITPLKIQSTHIANTLKRMKKESGTYLLAEDTTEPCWPTRQKVSGLGVVGPSTSKSQGFLLHTVLAMKWESDSYIQTLTQKKPPIEIIGIANQQYYKRQKKTKSRISSNNKRESDLWINSLENMNLSDKSNARFVRVCDRGADIYEVILNTINTKLGFVIRAAQNRNLDNTSNEKLFDYVKKEGKELGSFILSLRGRGCMKARDAKLSISYCKVSIKSPRRKGFPAGQLQTIKCGVVRVFEKKPPNGNKPLEWFLLCDQKVVKLKQALVIVQQYACRWITEDFHKALKSGTKIEKLQLSDANRLYAAIAFFSVIALQIVDLREHVRIHSLAPAVKSGLTSIELTVLSSYLKRQLKTVKDVALAIGRLGGHMNRKSDGMPGFLTLTSGRERLNSLVDGFELSMNMFKKND